MTFNDITAFHQILGLDNLVRQPKDEMRRWRPQLYPILSNLCPPPYTL